MKSFVLLENKVLTVSNVENPDKDKIDLSDEADFEAFLTDSDAYTIIDKDSPYYRWDITFTQEEMTDAIETVLENCIISLLI